MGFICTTLAFLKQSTFPSAPPTAGEDCLLRPPLCAGRGRNDCVLLTDRRPARHSVGRAAALAPGRGSQCARGDWRAVLCVSGSDCLLSLPWIAQSCASCFCGRRQQLAAASRCAAGAPCTPAVHGTGPTCLRHFPRCSFYPSPMLPAARPCSCRFYLTPMLLPLLREMPAGKVGVDVTCKALQVVTVGAQCALQLLNFCVAQAG